jgi:hypothetical protein
MGRWEWDDEDGGFVLTEEARRNLHADPERRMQSH